MRSHRRIVRKWRSYYARVALPEGGETSFPLGPDRGRAETLHDAIVCAVGKGRSAESIRAALREGRDPLADGPRAEPGEGAGTTVAAAASRWLSERVDAEMEARNAGIIRSRVERSLVPCLGARAIGTLRRTDCHSYLAHLRRTRPDLKPGSLHHYLRDLRELLGWAEEVELADSNPWPKRRIMPRVERRAPDRLTAEEVAVLVALPDHWGFTLRFLLSTGLRWGEACRARRRDVEGGQLLVRKTKTGEPRRVPLPRTILEEIMMRGGGWIVPRQRKAPGGRAERSSSSFNATIRRLADKRVAESKIPKEEREALSGLAEFHAHQTRHTFACRWLEAGGEIVTLQQVLGHASVQQTEAYGRPNERAVRADAERVFSAWGGR